MRPRASTSPGDPLPWPRAWVVALRLVGPFAANVAALVILKDVRDVADWAWMANWAATMFAVALLPFSGVIWPLLAATRMAATHVRGRASAAWNVGLFAAAVLANTCVWLLAW